MKRSRMQALRDSGWIILTLAGKDVIDALRNRFIITVMVMAAIIPLLPKMLPLIFELPDRMVPVYLAGTGEVPAIPEGMENIRLLRVQSEEDFRAAICRGPFPAIGLQFPPGFDNPGETAGALELQGYVCWGNRGQAPGLAQDLEDVLSTAWDRPVHILTGNWVFPSQEVGLAFGMTALNAVLVVLIIGLFLVPSLLFEEKESQTMQALLISPANISQVVFGKAGAGFFYILVAAMVIIGITWQDVVHWPIVILFVLLGGLFSVLLGLLIGSIWKKQQDAIGWMTAGIVLLAGAVVARQLVTGLPSVVAAVLDWVPTVAMMDLIRTAYLEAVPVGVVWRSSAVIIAYAGLLYLLTAWKIRRSDR